MSDEYNGLDVDEQIIAHLGTPDGAKIAYHLDPAYLEEDAAEALIFWLSYASEYGSPPSPEVLAREIGLDELPEPMDKAEYWLNEILSLQLKDEAGAALREAAKIGKTPGREREALEWLQGETVRVLDRAAPTTRAVQSLGTEGGVEWYERQASPAAEGLTYGFPDIDRALGGIRNGQLTVIVARLKRYKSWLAQKSAVESFGNGKRVTFAPLELPDGEFKTRVNCMLAGDLPWETVGKIQASAQQIERMSEVEAWMRKQDNPIHIVKPLPGQVNARTLASLVKQNESEVLYVDQLDFMDRDRSLPEWVEYGRIATELKQLALELDIPVVLCVQFNRQAVVKKFVDLGAEFVGHADKIPQVLDTLMASFATGRMKDNRVIHYGVLESRNCLAPRAWEIQVGLDKGADFTLIGEHDLHSDDDD